MSLIDLFLLFLIKFGLLVFGARDGHQLSKSNFQLVRCDELDHELCYDQKLSHSG